MLGNGFGGGTDKSNAESSLSPLPTIEQTEQQIPNVADKDTDITFNAPEGERQSNSSHSRDPRSWFGRPLKRAGESARESTPLLQRPLEILSEQAHEGPCNHGTFSPNTTSRPASIKSQETTDSARERGFFRSVAAGSASTNNVKRTATARLAEEHGLKLNKAMYAFHFVS